MEQTNKIEENLSSISEIINNLDKISIYILILILLIIIGVGYYIYIQFKKKDNNDENMKKNLEIEEIKTSVLSLNSIDINSNLDNYNLRDFYILSSYNSCANGNYKDSYVSLEALKSVIKRGVRLLDFEVYNIGGKPVVACSSKHSTFIKESYNSLDFSKVMDIALEYPFTSSWCDNPKDPLIINLRMKTGVIDVFNKVGDIIERKIHKNRSLIGNDKSINFGKKKMKELISKIIIICDGPKDILRQSKLYDIINMEVGTPFINKYRDYDVKNIDDSVEFKERNKENISITYADLSEKAINIDSSVHMKYGCQMICMNFQEIDENLKFYIDMFNEKRSAFVLKPKELRYEEKVIKEPTPQKIELSFAPKQATGDFYSIKI